MDDSIFDHSSACADERLPKSTKKLIACVARKWNQMTPAGRHLSTNIRSACMAAVISLSSLFVVNSATACMSVARLALSDVKYADVVVIGRVANYRLILDPEARERNRQMVAKMKPSKLRDSLSNISGFITDYARFEIQVEEVLQGQAPEIIEATWDNSTFGEPEKMPSGPFVIALRRSGSDRPPLRGPSATIVPNLEPQLLTVLQAPCSMPFIFELGGEQAQALLETLKAK
ncbi:hypothetical protein AB4Z25_08315 [Rhizobium sp. RAF36]|jgi:hypothetical protein|uniref:hypothetical protein n=1 Tax=Rhizobium sp. RAF36 TaxID=3233055 RepID=UPI003F9A062C